MYTLFYQCFPIAVMILTDVLIKLLFDNYHDNFVSQGNPKIFKFFRRGLSLKIIETIKGNLIVMLVHYYRSRNRPYVINRWFNIN